ncbi:winged helix-turn-helix domain-containing protein [Rathayibacter soli]|uniref:winged helix-turn-helix domain-containing protein n=1 Tax=Rathayibacter soli TaxID=3144168 RepID=UPI0027E54709|nr:crosslink repair DNA glycosylase YcaQ family protein [Glaciibacter superstes]
MRHTISPELARRVALVAQGFGGEHPTTVGSRQLNLLIQRLGLLQLDSVNVFERSHYLPVFARLGGYDKTLLDRLTFAAKGRYVEYWAHVAAIIPLETWPLLRWKMDFYRHDALKNPDSWAANNASMLQWLRDELAAKGPLAASQIEHDANKRRGPWWGWSDVKAGLETLFDWGEVTTAGRTRFERRYALAEQVLPNSVLNEHVSKADAIRELIRRSARAHGIGTLADLADYYRLKKAPALAAIRDLEDAGELVPVTVPGWDHRGAPLPVWLYRDARLPRRVSASALLSPFDPMVWERARALRMFNFHYRIEIYTPKPKRVYGYYVLPVLLDDRIVARVDLKNDRHAGVLRVQAAWQEPGAPTDAAPRIASLLRDTASWQGLDSITVAERGNLATELTAELRHSA